jgi:hypothetical protein
MVEKSDTAPLVSKRFGIVPGLRETEFIEKALAGAPVQVEALMDAYLNGILWCGAWRFYVTLDGQVFVLNLTKSDKPKTIKTINGVLSLAAKLGERKIDLPLMPD